MTRSLANPSDAPRGLLDEPHIMVMMHWFGQMQGRGYCGITESMGRYDNMIRVPSFALCSATVTICKARNASSRSSEFLTRLVTERWN